MYFGLRGRFPDRSTIIPLLARRAGPQRVKHGLLLIQSERIVPTMDKFFEIISAGSAVLAALTQVVGQIAVGQPAQLPPIRFSISGKHYELDATAKQV